MENFANDSFTLNTQEENIHIYIYNLFIQKDDLFNLYVFLKL